jgi:hypothetical protein
MKWREVVWAWERRRAVDRAASRAVEASGVRQARAAVTGVGMRKEQRACKYVIKKGKGERDILLFFQGG